MITNYFASNIRKLRKRKGLIQQQVADDLLITRSTLGAWEECRGTPDYNKLITISSYFEVSIDDLLKVQL